MSTSQNEDPRVGETDLMGGETAEDGHAQTAKILVDDDEDEAATRVLKNTIQTMMRSPTHLTI